MLKWLQWRGQVHRYSILPSYSKSLCMLCTTVYVCGSFFNFLLHWTGTIFFFFWFFLFFSCGLQGLCHWSTSTILLSSAFLLQFSTRQLRHKSRYVLCLYKFSLAIWPSQWLETWLSKIIGCQVTVFWSVFFSVLVEVWSACYGAVWLNRCWFGLFLFVVFFYIYFSLCWLLASGL